jgi:hypothetical protein
MTRVVKWVGVEGGLTRFLCLVLVCMLRNDLVPRLRELLLQSDTQLGVLSAFGIKFVLESSILHLRFRIATELA